MLTHLKMPNDKRRYQLSWGVHPLKKSREAVDIFRTGGGEAQPHSIAFGGVFPHYKGDSNMTKLTTKRHMLHVGQNENV